MAKRNKTAVAAARRRQEMPRTSATAATTPQPVDFREEYRYVLADLKRFGLLAASMIVLLVVLALVL